MAFKSTKNIVVGCYVDWYFAGIYRCQDPQNPIFVNITTGYVRFVLVYVVMFLKVINRSTPIDFKL